MPRRPRIDFENAWHHVINRGAARKRVFDDHWDYDCFLSSVAEASFRTNTEVHAYCLMSNHFHLLIRSREGRLSEFMKFLSGRFTRLRNIRRNEDGPIFKGRFWSSLIESDAYLMQASRYIHLNPVDAGLVRSAEAWPWSSAGFYLGHCQPKAWLTTAELLSIFSPSPEPKDYADYLAEGVDAETLNRYADAM